MSFDHHEKEEAAYCRAQTIGLLSLQRMPCSYGYRYKAQWYDGSYSILLTDEQNCYYAYLTEDTGFWCRPDGRDFTPDADGSSLDPFCPPYLEMSSHDIGGMLKDLKRERKWYGRYATR